MTYARWHKPCIVYRYLDIHLTPVRYICALYTDTYRLSLCIVKLGSNRTRDPRKEWQLHDLSHQLHLPSVYLSPVVSLPICFECIYLSIYLSSICRPIFIYLSSISLSTRGLSSTCSMSCGPRPPCAEYEELASLPKQTAKTEMQRRKN